MTKEIEMDPDAIVAEAEAAKDEAEALKLALENRIMAGDDSVTHEELSRQISLAQFAVKVVEGAKTKADAIRAANKIRSRVALKAEILEKAPENGEHLVALVDGLIASTSQLVEAADAHDAQVWDWAVRAKELGVPDKGVASADHEGLGVSAANDVLVDSVIVRTVNAKNILRLLFQQADGYGLLPVPVDSEYVASARSIVANLGKASV